MAMSSLTPIVDYKDCYKVKIYVMFVYVQWKLIKNQEEYK